MTSYVVQPNDSWFRIAGNEMGSQMYADTLAAANSHVTLRPGMVIDIPRELIGAEGANVISNAWASQQGMATSDQVVSGTGLPGQITGTHVPSAAPGGREGGLIGGGTRNTTGSRSGYATNPLGRSASRDRGLSDTSRVTLGDPYLPQEFRDNTSRTSSQGMIQAYANSLITGQPNAWYGDMREAYLTQRDTDYDRPSTVVHRPSTPTANRANVASRTESPPSSPLLGLIQRGQQIQNRQQIQSQKGVSIKRITGQATNVLPPSITPATRDRTLQLVTQLGNWQSDPTNYSPPDVLSSQDALAITLAYGLSSVDASTLFLSLGYSFDLGSRMWTYGSGPQGQLVPSGGMGSTDFSGIFPPLVGVGGRSGGSSTGRTDMSGIRSGSMSWRLATG